MSKIIVSTSAVAKNVKFLVITENDRGNGTIHNTLPKAPKGYATLYIIEGETVKAVARSELSKEPPRKEYVWGWITNELKFRYSNPVK